MNMQADLNNGGRWHHIASEREIARAMRDKNAEVIEAPVISCSFVVSRRWLTMVRAGAMGGDTFNIEGGWVFPNDIAFLLDVHEVKQVAAVTVRR